MYTKITGQRPNKGRSIINDDRGAIDMPSSMVAVIITGILFGAVAVTVFGVIPWAQNVIAKHNAETTASALDQYQTQSQAGIISGAAVQKAGYSYANAAGLEGSGILAKVPASVTIELKDGSSTYDPAGATAPSASILDDAYKVSVQLKNGDVYEVFGGANW